MEVKLESAITSITEIMGKISDQTTTWNYLKSAKNDLVAVLHAECKNNR